MSEAQDPFWVVQGPCFIFGALYSSKSRLMNKLTVTVNRPQDHLVESEEVRYPVKVSQAQVFTFQCHDEMLLKRIARLPTEQLLLLMPYRWNRRFPSFGVCAYMQSVSLCGPSEPQVKIILLFLSCGYSRLPRHRLSRYRSHGMLKNLNRFVGALTSPTCGS